MAEPSSSGSSQSAPSQDNIYPEPSVETVVIKEEGQQISLTFENFDGDDFEPNIEETNLEWLPTVFNLIEVCDGGYVSGFVRTEEELVTVMEAHSRHTESRFGLECDDGQRKLNRARRLFYYCKHLDLSSHITSSERSRLYACSFGFRFNVKKRSKDHNYSEDDKSRQSTGKSRTICPAKIVVNEITVYNDYPIDGLNKRLRQERLNELKIALMKNPTEIRFEKYIHIKLPLKSSHTGHSPNEHIWKSKQTHPNLLKKIEEFTLLGIRKLSILKALLTSYAEETLIKGDVEKFKDITYFFPSEQIIQNKMRSVIREHGLSLVRIGAGKNIQKDAAKVRCHIKGNGSNVMRISRSKKDEQN